jgi:hypothetical protein
VVAAASEISVRIGVLLMGTTSGTPRGWGGTR